MATGGSREKEKNIWHETELLRKGNPSIYNIKCSSETVVKESSKIRKCELGTKNTDHLSEKVILFVGETGAGKTTMINRVVNYLLGVQWEDDERYKLILDKEEESEEESSQTQSKTKWITSYTFNHTKLPSWRVTLVDTPGIGDTEGKKRDNFITDQIKEFFGTRGEGGIDHIDAVGFVLKANSQRLTESQVYVFNSVLRLFGKDISQNVFLFVTYADIENYEEGEHPAVIEAVKKANVPFHKYYMFNNVALFRNKKNTGRRASSSASENLWRYATEDLSQFFKQLTACEPQSIYLTAEVLSERTVLEIIVQSLPARITTCLVEIKKIEEEEKALKFYRQETENNKNFTFTVNEQIQVEKEIGSEKAVVCTTCDYTCHYPCLVNQVAHCSSLRNNAVMIDKFKVSLGVLKPNEITKDLPICYACPGRCRSDKHNLGNYIFEPKIVERVKTQEDIKSRYLDAWDKVMKTENIITKCKKKLLDAQETVTVALEMLRACLHRLDEIALKSDSLSVADYLDNLINAQRLKGEPGWEKRVEELDKLLKREKTRGEKENLK